MLENTLSAWLYRQGGDTRGVPLHRARHQQEVAAEWGEEDTRTPPEESDISPTIDNPSNILFIMCLPQEYGRHLVRLQQAGLINLENTHLRHEAEQRRAHIIHTLYHIYWTIPTISTTLYFPYLQHYIYTISTQYYIHHTQAGPAHIHAVRASLPRPRRRPRLSSCSFSLRDYVLEK